jgi:hypothetical protein
LDPKNLFLTPTTYRLVRLEYLGLLVVVATLAVLHLDEIRWLPFAVLFLYIDVIGYLPGVVAHKRRGTAYLPRAYYLLYNSMHSLLTAGIVAGAWCLVFGPEWALLALPLHLFGDRALFGNFYKSFGIEFEPSAHPDYAAAKPMLDRPRRPATGGTAESSAGTASLVAS